jgi:hypothetical protein
MRESNRFVLRVLCVLRGDYFFSFFNSFAFRATPQR